MSLIVSLRTTTRGHEGAPGDPAEQDAAMAAASLYEKLEAGTYTDRGKRRKIAGDTSKLFFAQK